jgi:hypothetical protein
LKSKTNVRINELARELEVKAQAILEALPEIGVEEKKTHSSSLDEPLAQEIRDYFQKKADQPVDEIEVHLESAADTIASVRSADARAQVVAQPIPPVAPAATPPIPSGGGMPLERFRITDLLESMGSSVQDSSSLRSRWLGSRTGRDRSRICSLARSVSVLTAVRPLLNLGSTYRRNAPSIRSFSRLSHLRVRVGSKSTNVKN